MFCSPTNGMPTHEGTWRPCPHDRPEAICLEGCQMDQRRSRFPEHDEKGFWEVRGYSNTAFPWKTTGTATYGL